MTTAVRSIAGARYRAKREEARKHYDFADTLRQEGYRLLEAADRADAAGAKAEFEADELRAQIPVWGGPT
jgi:hypothetical protein